jgi:hypothetical protein
MTKEEILNGMSEEEFYNLYPTEEAYFMAKGGSLSGAPYNGQPTADEFFSYGAPALGHMNIPMSNPTYLAHGGTYFGGPIYPAQMGTATPVPAMDPDVWEKTMAKPAVSGMNNPPTKPVNFPTFNTRSQYDKFKAGNVDFNKYSDADMQGLGVNVPAQQDMVAFKKQEEWNKANPWSRSSETTPEGAQLFYKTGQSGTPQDYLFNTKSGSYDPYNPAVAGTRPAIPAVTMAYGGVTEYCWGGGLPGGPNEMPEMLQGGYNSPTSYGSFSVPMADGGYYQTGGSNDLVDWAAKQQQMLEQRTNVGVPPNVKKYFGAFDEPRKFDSTHVYPGDPNIAMGFKGNKVMLISKDGDAENTVRRVNKPRTFVGPTVKGERDVYFDYLTPHEYGGILDASTNQEYPMMEEGGRSNLMKIIKAAAKKMKKEYAAGGDITMQGGNQDFIANRKDTYNNYIKQNVYNSILDQEQQDLSKAFMQKGGQPSFFQMLAEKYAPTERVSGLNYFPANINRGYELSNQDYSKLSQLGSDAKLSGLGVTYGPLARGLGKFGRKMFGPKEIYFDIMHNKPTIQTKPYQQASATNTAPAETDRRVIRDPNREMNLGPAIQPKANPNFNWETTFGYGGNYQTGGNPSAMSNNWSFAGAPAPQFTTPQSVGIQAPTPITMQDSGAPLVSGDTMLNKDTSRVGLKRDNSGLLNAIGQYAVPGINTLAGMIEAPGQQKRQKQAMLNAMTPGSDTGPFAVKPANAMSRGDYDPNTGMFRPNAMVPVQFPGGTYGAYGGSFQDGGMFEEGEEYELSPEEIEELKAQGYDIEELD